MTTPRVGPVLNSSGDPIMGATVLLFRKNTVRNLVAETLTDAHGYWDFPEFDKTLHSVVIIYGAERRYLNYDSFPGSTLISEMD